MSNIFKAAAQQKLRFASEKGFLTVEQLFDLPLTSRTGFDLDAVAKVVAAELKSQQEESFVVTTVNSKKAHLELKLELVKEVIADKIAESEAKTVAAQRLSEKRKLLEVLEGKKDEALAGLSIEQLEAKIAALG